MLLLKFHNHLLIILLSIEFLVVRNLINIYYNIYIIDYYILIFIVIFVIEGVLGISLMIIMIRFYGNDLIRNLMLIL